MKLQTFTEPVYAFVRVVCNVMLAIQVVLICYVVFARFVLNNSPSWGEEFSLLLMVWFCLLSPAEALKENRHLAITLLEKVLPGPVIRVVDAVNHVLILVFAVFMVVEGTGLAELTVRNIMPGMGVSATWLYASVPVAGAILAMAAVERLIEILSIPGKDYLELGCKN
ncbi:TRAP transporter small permease [Tropicimonas marinistellae]|uniref:TRAP transporter small permease n=1 Tax=Tropicimonas marinistellae TaxID=1739787 RepID=UPI00083076BF|nr:TRAP transporter small permease [Tropicimonas marinistellae]